jgi:hypothetical protein
MMLRNDDELANSQRKLTELERLIVQAGHDKTGGRATQMRSLTRLANELRAEVIRYQTCQKRHSS